ncbi:TPA: hypothetical protein ACPOJ5_001436 [Haemophilus influenzae]
MGFGNFANVMTTESGKNLINDVVISGDCSIEMPKNGRKVAHKTTRCSSCKSTNSSRCTITDAKTNGAATWKTV